MDPHHLLADWLRTIFPVAPPSPANRALPSFLLPNHEGWLLSSEEMQAQGPYVLTFFHGSWCPACVRKLRLLEASLDRIHELGADVVACSPETFGFLRRLRADNGLRFRVVSDMDCALSVDLGLAFALPEAARRRLADLQIDLRARHGDGRWMLPIPVTMIVDRNGEVAEAYMDCGQDAHVDEVLAALANV